MRTVALWSLALLAANPRALEAGSRVPPVASYRIEASLDEGHRIAGKETVTFVNRTRHRFEDLRLHLYLNGFRNESATWLREERAGGGRDRKSGRDERWFGYSEINRVALADGTDLTSGVTVLAPDDGNPDDRTVVSIRLPQPVEPGATLVFDLDFVAKLPRGIARTGWKDDFTMGAQWFPKLGVATDEGWNCHQFHAGTEFFADFGDYDVTLTMPRDVKGRIGATGVLKEESEMAGGNVRVRFLAEDVHDFAFTASPRFDVVRDTFTQPGLPNVGLLLLLQPDHRSSRERYLKGAKAALASYGTWFVPYPYPSLTIVDPPAGSHASGMEYPTLIVGGTHWLQPEDGNDPQDVTVHELGHQIFYGLLASNEFEEAHLDEGFNTYATYRTLKKAFGDPAWVKRLFGIPVVFRSVRLPYPALQRRKYFDWQLSSRSDAPANPTFRDLDGLAVVNNAYAKTALLLASCERTLGEETWGRILKTYATRFAFRHPTTKDFRDVATEVAGPGVDDLFHETWDSSNTIDYAVTVAESHRMEVPAGYAGDGAALKFLPAETTDGPRNGPVRYESTVVVRRLGEASWPTEVELRFDGGQVIRKSWDGKARWIRYRITGPKLREAVADPDGKDLLDANVLNNGLRVETDRAAANLWGHRARFWAQNVLELFALLGMAR